MLDTAVGFVCVPVRNVVQVFLLETDLVWIEFVGHNLTPKAMYLAEMLDGSPRRGHVKKI